MTYLVDANVLSEPTKAAPKQQVVDWLQANEEDLVVDPIILGELQTGILALERGKKRAELEEWFEGVVASIECLPWDAAVSRRWAALVVDLKRNGESMPTLDCMIAATALHHELTVATQNVRDFKKAGVKTRNPFD